MSKLHEAAEKIVECYEKVEDAVVGSYKKVENTVVGSYKKVEDTVVGSFTRVADQFVDAFLTREGESVEEAREWLAEEQKARQVERDARIEESLEASRNAGKRN